MWFSFRVSLCLAIVAFCSLANFTFAAETAEELQARQQAIREAVVKAAPSIVRIETIGGLDVVDNVLTAAGPTTGVVVGADGLILTSSFNFIAKPASILVTLPDGRRFSADVVATDHSRMLTLLKIDAGGLTPLDPAPKDEVRVGQWAVGVGRTYSIEQPNLSVGIISATNRVWGRAIQTDAKVSPVNYGGPLLDLHGRTIGILVPLSPQRLEETAGVEWYDSGIGFAVPLEDVFAVLDRLRSGEDLHPGKAGISFADSKALFQPPKIERVWPGSPAAIAGLQAKDTVIQVDGRDIERYSQLKQLLGPKYAGETIAIAVQRDEEVVEVSLELVAELSPYEPQFLGILPQRFPADEDSSRQAGDERVIVRHVFAESPAAKAGLQPGDEITAFGNDPVTGADDLRHRISLLPPESVVSLTWQGVSGEMTAEVALVPDSGGIPETLEPTPSQPGEVNVRVGRFTETLPEGERYWAYVPTNYSPQTPHSLLVWFHPAGDTRESEVFNQLKPLCNSWHVILVAPQSGGLTGWSPAKLPMVKTLIEEFAEQYQVAAVRTAVLGEQDGARMAMFAAARMSEQVRGAALLRTKFDLQLPTQSPDERLSVLLMASEDEDLEAMAETLRDQSFPTAAIRVEDSETFLSGDAATRLFQWIDSLDRL